MTETFIKSQILRLAGMDFYPATKEAVGELLKVLWTHADSEDHAQRIITRAIEQAPDRRCPTPAELIRLAAQVSEVETLPAGCQRCHGSGWRTETRRTSPWPGTEYDAEYAVHCECGRGTFLRQHEAARKSKEGAA